MSLVTHPGNIAIDEDQSSNPSSGGDSNSEDDYIYRALRHISTTDDHTTESSTDMERGGRYRRGSTSGQKGMQQFQGGNKNKQQPPPRKFNPKALERLTAPTTASRSRSQRKYTDQLLDMKKEETSSPHKTISPVATKAGIRLYAEAMGQRKHLERLREEREKLLKQKEEKPTFQPKITSLAKRMGEGGYIPPHERYTHTNEKLAKKHLLQEKERMERITAGCTFHPTLASTSKKLANKQRKNEPFEDVGERLYFEGGKRLIRQKLRERILEQNAERRVVGAFQITQQAANELSSRLLRWQEECDRNREAAQKAYLRSITKPVSSTNKLNSGREIQCSCCRSCQPSCSVTKTVEIPIENELRRMHCRALFFKYAPSDKSLSVQLEDVKKQVRELFPEDSSIVAALMANFRDGEPISRSDFVESLLRFEHLHGPQPWGQPSSENVRTAFGNLLTSQLSLVPPLQSFSTPREREKKIPQTRKRASSVHTMHLEKKDNVRKKNGILPLSPSSSYRRSSSETVYERLSRKSDVRSDRHELHHKKEKMVGNVSGELLHQKSAELSALNNEKRLLDRQELELLRKQKQILEKQRNSIRESSLTQKSQERSPSLGSVELSSLTENCSTTPNMKRPEDVVAELEALMGTPTERSCRASPPPPNISHAQEGKRNSVYSLPSALRRRMGPVPVPSKGAESVSYAGSHNRRMTQERVLKEIEEILGED